MRKQFERAAAESFANITPIQSACYHYLNDGFSEHNQITLRNYFLPVILLKGIKDKYADKVVMTALVELTYPTTLDNSHTWSGCQRSAFCGIPQKTWSRNNLCEPTNFIIDTITTNADSVSRAIHQQLNLENNSLSTVA